MGGSMVKSTQKYVFHFYLCKDQSKIICTSNFYLVKKLTIAINKLWYVEINNITFNDWYEYILWIYDNGIEKSFI